jgi:hypothetical protein
MKGILTKLNEHKLGAMKEYVIYFMGSIMAIDQKSCWAAESSARRALSVMLSRLYNSTPALKKTYKDIGAYRKSLEENNLVKVCPSTHLDIVVKIR